MKKYKDLVVEYWDVERLIPYARNPRKNEEAAQKLAGVIAEFGFQVPIIIRGTGEVIDGHARLKAASILGIKKVPVIINDEWTETQAKAFRLSVNKSAEWAEWDDELLKLELDDLKLEDFDLDLIGFDDVELESLEPEEPDEKYTAKIDIPQYEPTGKHVALAECTDTRKYDELMAEIEKCHCSETIKAFLRLAATRHIEFSYKNIAEYYANDADVDTQALFEKMALVIIDYNDAMKNGYVKISKELDKIVEANDE